MLATNAIGLARCPGSATGKIDRSLLCIMAGATRIPPLSLTLGYGPMAAFPVLALAAWLAPPPWPAIAIAAGQGWGAALLVFLAGVRRGLSFLTEGGPRPAQIATMLWLFLLGGASLLTTPRIAFALLVVGYGSIALLDPTAARRGEVPAFFARLRPPQMGLALVGLVALLVKVAV